MAKLINIHTGLPLPEDGEGQVAMVTGEYQYYHYGCDGVDDRVSCWKVWRGRQSGDDMVVAIIVTLHPPDGRRLVCVIRHLLK